MLRRQAAWRINRQKNGHNKKDEEVKSLMKCSNCGREIASAQIWECHSCNIYMCPECAVNGMGMCPHCFSPVKPYS